MTLKLSVLDQSPISSGSNAKEALQYTVKLAQLADRLGYTRFLVSEHHDARTLAGSSPEILIAHLASMTERIRVGSGGVMLPHYSAYKVAENFKVLEALFPNRIDIGIGRAPGGMPRASYALNDGKYQKVDHYPEQIEDLLIYLHDEASNDFKYPGLRATPIIDTVPKLWMLGSSPNSARLAAEKELPYIFAHFINNEAGEVAMRTYHNEYSPNATRPKESAVAVFFVCAETEEEVEEIVSSLDLSLLMLAQGMPSNGTPSPEFAMNYPYTAFDRRAIAENRKRMVIGTPKQVRAQLEQLAERYDTDEFILVMTAYDYEKKLKAYELLAKEML